MFTYHIFRVYILIHEDNGGNEKHKTNEVIQHPFDTAGCGISRWWDFVNPDWNYTWHSHIWGCHHNRVDPFTAMCLYDGKLATFSRHQIHLPSQFAPFLSLWPSVLPTWSLSFGQTHKRVHGHYLPQQHVTSHRMPLVWGAFWLECRLGSSGRMHNLLYHASWIPPVHVSTINWPFLLTAAYLLFSTKLVYFDWSLQYGFDSHWSAYTLGWSDFPVTTA